MFMVCLPDRRAASAFCEAGCRPISGFGRVVRNKRIEMAIELARDERAAGTPFRFFLFRASVICIHAQDIFEFANAAAFPGPFSCVSASGECALPYRTSLFA